MTPVDLLSFLTSVLFIAFGYGLGLTLLLYWWRFRDTIQ